MVLFLQMYAACLIAGLMLPRAWRAWSKERPARTILASVGGHAASAFVLVNVGLTQRVAMAILALAVMHTMVDHATAYSTKGGLLAFVLSQFMHLALTAGAVLVLGPEPAAAILSTGSALLSRPRLYLILSGYVGVVAGGGYVVQKVTESFMAKLEPALRELKPGLPSAGTYIGWVERFLVLTFVLAGSHEAIGFLLAVKALVRFPEIQEDRRGSFGEYFLVGTFTSISIALMGGALLLRLVGRV